MPMAWLIFQMRSKQYGRIAPIEFIRVMWTVCNQFIGGHQHDAHEFLGSVVQAVNMEHIFGVDSVREGRRCVKTPEHLSVDVYGGVIELIVPCKPSNSPTPNRAVNENAFRNKRLH